MEYFITKKQIDYDKKLKYLITMPCVNREEHNSINVLSNTFKNFELSGLFDSDIDIDIVLFESSSKDITYLDFINEYKSKYNKNIEILFSKIKLNAVSNALRMHIYISKLPEDKYDFILWMDDDIYLCKNFIKNADIWIKNYANFSIFSSLYVPINSSFIKNRKYVHLTDLSRFYGTCCVVFKSRISKYVISNWYNDHFERFDYNPDTRFRDSVKMNFPYIKKICVSFPSLVDHMNIGSSIQKKKHVNNGHKAKVFAGIDNDPKIYINDLYNNIF